MITIDLPSPISSNVTRRINWKAHKRHKMWRALAEAMVFEQWHSIKKARMLGRFEIKILLPEKIRIDPDNAIKGLLDFLKSMALIVDDSPRYVKRIIVEVGGVDEGCRVILTPL